MIFFPWKICSYIFFHNVLLFLRAEISNISISWKVYYTFDIDKTFSEENSIGSLVFFLHLNKDLRYMNISMETQFLQVSLLSKVYWPPREYNIVSKLFWTFIFMISFSWYILSLGNCILLPGLQLVSTYRYLSNVFFNHRPFYQPTELIPNYPQDIIILMSHNISNLRSRHLNNYFLLIKKLPSSTVYYLNTTVSINYYCITTHSKIECK